VAPRQVQVGVCFGSFRKVTDGLGEFALQLGRRLADRAPALASAHGIRLHFQMPADRHGMFGGEVRYLDLRPAQRLLHLQGTRFDLWHTLNQHISHPPPVGTPHRLLTVADLNHLYTKRGPSLALHQVKARIRLARADRVATISRYVAQDVRRVGFAGPIDVIHLGARSLAGQPMEPVSGVEAGRYLFHLSRMAPSKNVGAILDLAASWPEQPFVLGGPASGKVEAVRTEVEERRLANVQVFDDLSDAQKGWLYAHCAGFLFPSLTEGFGLPPLEAMHFGKPAFLSDLTCLPEIGGEAAWYFERFDPGSMRRVIVAGLEEARRPGSAERIQAHAARFSWDACTETYIALYLSILGLAAPPPTRAP
jgi:glycosyltransferase involved in cell wall biosynthesis